MDDKNDFFSKTFGSTEQNFLNFQENQPIQFDEVEKNKPILENDFLEGLSLKSETNNNVGSSSIHSFFLSKECSFCLKRNEETANFCSKCGTRFENNKQDLIKQEQQKNSLVEKQAINPIKEEQCYKTKEIQEQRPIKGAIVCCFGKNNLIIKTAPVFLKRNTPHGVIEQKQQGTIDVLKTKFFVVGQLEESCFPINNKESILLFIRNKIEEEKNEQFFLWKYAENLLLGKKSLSFLGDKTWNEIDEEVFNELEQQKTVSNLQMKELAFCGPRKTSLNNNFLLSFFVSQTFNENDYQKWFHNISERFLKPNHPLRIIFFVYLKDKNSIEKELETMGEMIVVYWKFLLQTLSHTETEDSFSAITLIGSFLEKYNKILEAQLCFLVAKKVDLFENRKNLFGKKTIRNIFSKETLQCFQLTEIIEYALKENKTIHSFKFMAKERVRFVEKLFEAGQMELATKYCSICFSEGMEKEITRLQGIFGKVEQKEDKAINKFWNVVDSGISKIIGIKEEDEKEQFIIPKIITEEKNEQELEKEENNVRKLEKNQTSESTFKSEKQHSITETEKNDSINPSNTGFMGKVKGFFSFKNKTEDNTESIADLGSECSFYYDKNLKRWVDKTKNELETEKEIPAIPTKPKTNIQQTIRQEADAPFYFDFMNSKKD